MPEERIRQDLDRLVDDVVSLRARPRRLQFVRGRMPSARRIAAITLGEWRALVLTLGVTAGVELGMALLPLPRLARLARVRLTFESDPDPEGRPLQDTGLGPRGPESFVTDRERRRIWATDRILARWPFGDTCLRRALVLGFHLRAHHPLLRIGVATEGASPPPGGGAGQDAPPALAHAWIETDRMTLLTQPGYESLVVSVR